MWKNYEYIKFITFKYIKDARKVSIKKCVSGNSRSIKYVLKDNCYECGVCGSAFHQNRKFKEKREPQHCPSCEKQTIRNLPLL